MECELDSVSADEQDIPRLEDRSAAIAAAGRARLRSPRPSGPFRIGVDRGRNRSDRDRCRLFEREGPAAVQPAYDDGAVALW